MLDKTDKLYAATMETLAYSKDPDAHDTSVVLNDAYMRYGLNGLYCRRAVLGSMLGAYVIGASILGIKQPLLKYPIAALGTAAVAIQVAAAQGPRRRKNDARSEIESIAIESANKKRDGFQASDSSVSKTIPAGMTLDTTVTKYSCRESDE